MQQRKKKQEELTEKPGEHWSNNFVDSSSETSATKNPEKNATKQSKENPNESHFGEISDPDLTYLNSSESLKRKPHSSLFKSRPSLFSSEEESGTSFRGLINLGLLLLVRRS